MSGTDSAAHAAKRTLLVLSGTRHPAALRAPNGCSAFNTKAELAAFMPWWVQILFRVILGKSHNFIFFLAKILRTFSFLSLFINDPFSPDSLFFRYEVIRVR